MAAKLHELLAIETSLENQANKVRADLGNTFEKKRHLFEEKQTTFTPNTEGAPSVTEAQSTIQTTVLDELLGFFAPHQAKYWDAAYQVADANTRAKADIVLENGEAFLKDIPATALLELEKRTAELTELIKTIPTLDPARGFTSDPNRQNVFAAREITKTRTKKTKTVIVLYPAVDKHPAQVQLIDEDVPTGTIRELEWSGLITPAEKVALLDRAEMIQRAVRAARSRANDAEVNPGLRIGAKILEFVFGAKPKVQPRNN